MDPLQLAKDAGALSGPVLAFLALITGGLGVWGFTWTHKQQMALKDETLLVVTKDRDYWRDQAIKGAALNGDLVQQNEKLTSITETLTAVVSAKVAP